MSSMKQSPTHYGRGLPRQPRPGRLGRILRYGGQKREFFGSAPHTTNNRMELTAAIEGLRALKEPCEVEIITDSEYVKNGITEWIQNWKRNGWMTSGKKPVVNQDLWQPSTKWPPAPNGWVWTKGHASHADNNRCDELAQAAARGQLSSES